MTERTFTSEQTDAELAGLDMLWQLLGEFDYETQTRMIAATSRRIADKKREANAERLRLLSETVEGPTS